MTYISQEKLNDITDKLFAVQPVKGKCFKCDSPSVALAKFEFMGYFAHTRQLCKEHLEIYKGGFDT